MSSLVVLALLFSLVARADIVVLANKQLDIHHLSRQQVAEIFLAKPIQGDVNGNPEPYDQMPTSVAYRIFYKHVANMSVAAVNQYWANLVFSGQASAPQQLQNNSEVVAAVEQNPSAIVYIDRDQMPVSVLAYARIVYSINTKPLSARDIHPLVLAHRHKAPVHHAAQHTRAKAIAAKKALKPVKKAKTKPVPIKQVQSEKIQPKKVLPAKKATKPAAPAAVQPQQESFSLEPIKSVGKKVAHTAVQAAAALKSAGGSFSKQLADLTAQVKTASHSLASKVHSPTVLHISGSAATGLWRILGEHFSMKKMDNRPEVRAQLNWFLEHRHLLMHIIDNAKPYLYYVYQQTEKKHLPAELALLPMIESGYDPYAYSRAGATGLWQMMPATASSLGLMINWWYDGRRDVVASTNVSLDYLKDLHDYFHNWPLAIAAYDAGQGTVESALQGNRSMGRSSSYWKLQLPTETRQYLPKLLALSDIILHPAQYAVTLPEVPDTPYFVAIPVHSQTTLSQVARMSGVSESEIQRLNPGLRRWASEPNTSYGMLIPITHAEHFRLALARLSGHKQYSWMYHEVRAGETLLSIANNYHTSVSLLRRINGFTSRQQVTAHQGILVPVNLHRSFNVSGKGRQTQTILPQHSFVQQPADLHSAKIKSSDSLKTILDKLHGENY